MHSTRRITRSSTHADRNASPSKLRAVSPEEVESWSDTESDGTLFEFDLCDLDEARPYTFQQGDRVWVKTTGGNWCSGKVNSQTTRKGPTREKEGLFYPVVFSKGNVRKYFAPLNGEIKPDTAEMRHLLKQGGWVEDGLL
ncbi:hypothetical protein BDQ12DRAFT_651019 [Crucibulum laeve]|uniref:Uncharacterized protein n=1 Tax=Crucibulum laeve TaxID=68775 RepID=A0A5C3M1V3_9AGAR|nr:hypothetical protein BDQ12DRAFT_651019 [Crucibulum laeve]